MPLLLWLLFLVIIGALLYRKSRSTSPSGQPAPPSESHAKQAPAAAIAPPPEELRRRRAALLDRAAPAPIVSDVTPATSTQTTQTVVAPPSPVPKLKLAVSPRSPKVTPESPAPSDIPVFAPLTRPAPPPQSLESFLAQVLRVTLTPPAVSKSETPRASLRYLSAAAKDLAGAKQDVADLDPSHIDLILAEALSESAGRARLPFLLNAFAQLERRPLPAAVAQSWRRALAAQMSILLLEPSLPTHTPRPDDMPVSQFLAALLSAEAFPLTSEALTLVCEQMSAQERTALFSPMLQRIRAMMHRSSLSSGTFAPPLTALQRLTSCPLLCAQLVSEPTWLPPSVTGVSFETQPYLSAFFRLYAFEDRESIFQHFANAALANYDTEVQGGISSLQSQVRGVQASVHAIVLALLRERSSREGMMQYLRTAVQVNNVRTQLGAQVGLGRGAGSSHGFMLNLTALMVALSAPYATTPAPPGGPSLEVALLASPAFANSTRVIMSEAQLNEWRQTLAANSERLHFVSESFALTHAVMRVGQGPVVKHYMEFLRTMQRVMSSSAGAPDHPQLKRLLQIKASMDVHLLDPMLIAFHMRFCGYTADWLLTLIHPTTPWPPVVVAPSKAINSAWEAIPESILEEMGDLLTLASMLQYPPTEGLDSIVSLFVTLMLSPGLLCNPHLRAGLFSHLYPFTSRPSHRARENTIDDHPLWSAHLARILLTVFADAEAAERDKYHLRREVSTLLRQERGTNPDFSRQLGAVVQQDPALGLRFSHLLVSDVLATFDETLLHMKQVQEHEAEKSEPQWLVLTPQQRAERENAHSLSDSNARAYVAMFTEYLSLLEMIAEMSPSILLLQTPELNVAQVTAQLVNYLLDNLTRPYLLPAKTEKYNLDSLSLIGTVMNIAVLLGDSPVRSLSHPEKVFVEEIAGDDRSFNEKKFARILRFAGSLLSTQTEVQRFEQLIQRATRIRAEKMGTEEALAEAPDDFVDPISCAVMDDPVQLPTSGKVVDRATITRILLSKAADPFNRAPLTIDQVKDLPELKEKIRSWKESQLSRST